MKAVQLAGGVRAGIFFFEFYLFERACTSGGEREKQAPHCAGTPSGAWHDLARRQTLAWEPPGAPEKRFLTS